MRQNKPHLRIGDMKLGRRKVENPATARRILAAAERHFAAQGMAGARTDEIAADAHANKAMLYYYFGNKRRLHRAVLENLFRQLRKVVYAPPAADAPPRDRLRSWVNGYFDFLATHPNYPRLVQREAMDATPKIEWIARDYFQPFFKHLTGLISEGISAGEFREVDPAPDRLHDARRHSLLLRLRAGDETDRQGTICFAATHSKRAAGHCSISSSTASSASIRNGATRVPQRGLDDRAKIHSRD